MKLWTLFYLLLMDSVSNKRHIAKSG